ncbi:MAG: HlyD family efflux transporter periplasmic adaptor subunit [Planctomycetaceae bacterium]|nr:HlyD family efflux transporter periplasmic adaptor subunit [Planctomycetaceae bacterium]
MNYLLISFALLFSVLADEHPVVPPSPADTIFSPIPLSAPLTPSGNVPPAAPAVITPAVPAATPNVLSADTIEIKSVTDIEPLRPNPTGSIETHGILKIPKHNNAILAANYQAMLMELRTEQRDTAGNIIKDASGNPVIVPIREGMYVFKDQVLVKLDDRELRIQKEIAEKKLDVARAAKEKQVEVEYAARQVQTATASYNIYKETNMRHEGAITTMELLRAELEVSQAKANLELQRYVLSVEKEAEFRAQEKEVEGMDVRIGLRQLVAPISGVVVKIERAEGEWLREGDPVLEIVQLDTLRADCKVDARSYTPNMVDGKTVTVLMPTVNGQTEQFPGKVIFADPRVTPGNEFEVFIEVKNRRIGNHWSLQPGRMVKALIQL